MWTNVMKAVVTLGALGLICGIVLAVASKVFAVKVDPRIEKIDAALPHANCGGCGFAGCSAFASAVVNGEAPPSGCTAGGPAVARAVAKVLGVEVDERERIIAHVYCSGGNVTTRKFNYMGVQSCFAAGRIAGGPSECAFACLGFGDCERACPFNAIHVKDGHAEVNPEACRGCGKCVAACPRKIIKMIPASAKVNVDCSSRDRGAFVRTVCDAGCIGCTLCAKKCPTGAVTVKDNLASINQEKCVGCGICASVCPRKIIHVEGGFAVLDLDEAVTEKQ